MMQNEIMHINKNEEAKIVRFHSMSMFGKNGGKNGKNIHTDRKNGYPRGAFAKNLRIKFI